MSSFKMSELGKNSLGSNSKKISIEKNNLEGYNLILYCDKYPQRRAGNFQKFICSILYISFYYN